MFSDELIRLEIERYRPTQEVLTEQDVADFKDSVVDITEERARMALEYLKGRSWFWRKLMACLDMPEDTTPDELNVVQLLGNPNFEIGVLVAMRQLGKPVMDTKIGRLEDSKIRIEPEQVKTTKPKQKSKK
jgi:hypothetical protein